MEEMLQDAAEVGVEVEVESEEDLSDPDERHGTAASEAEPVDESDEDAAPIAPAPSAKALGKRKASPFFAHTPAAPSTDDASDDADAERDAAPEMMMMLSGVRDFYERETRRTQRRR